MTCAEFTDHAAELALGTLEGEHRAPALMHADACPSCRALLQDLSLTSDALLQLAPSAEPPVGFESRLFDILSGDRVVPRTRRWRRPLAVFTAAAAVAVILGFGIGRMTSGHVDTVSAPRGVAVANLMTGTDWHGQVVVAPGHPPWVFVSVSDLGPINSVVCQVTLTNGRTVRVGTFALAHGYGGWTVPLTVGADQVRSAELLRPDGSQIISAKFS